MSINQIKGMKSNVAIIISSCDAFQDCWMPFIHSFHKYASECPYNIYILSNSNSICVGGVNFITVGEDRGWASNLKVALRLIREEYILYLQEDYFLNKNIKWNELQRHISYCMSNEVDYLRLTFPYIFGKVRDTCYVENSLDQAYSVCLQAALWKKSVLSDLCIDGWSGWDFERNVASLIRERIPNFCFYGLSRSANGQVSYVKGTGVRKGKWTNSGYHFLSSNGFDYLLNNREKEPSYYMLLDVDGFWRPFAKIIWRFIHKLFF